MAQPLHDLIVVVEFGGRASQTIARKVRELQVYCEVWPSTTPVENFVSARVKGVVLTAGKEADGLQTAADALRREGIPTFTVAPDAPEQDETIRDLERFLAVECGVDRSWTPERFIEDQVAQIQAAVGPTDKVICGLSGGVDSSVAAALVHRAIGDRLITIFVDHGLLRRGEADEVARIFRARFGAHFVHVDAGERFLQRLAGVTDPEAKRRIIGNEFIRVFEEEARRFGDIRYLVQGTVYPDVIESGVGGAIVKSHHNVGGLPEHMNLALIEPLRYLFKDEVRKVGLALGLPEELIWRQPFPGPGLAIRIMGEVTRERLDIARACDAIMREELAAAGLMRDVWQAFVVLTETRSVGVDDSGRTYGYVAAVRAVSAVDGMTARWVRLPYDVLDRISSRIMAEVPAVGRVVYDISSKPPATIEWE